MVALCLGLVNQTRISSGSSHELHYSVVNLTHLIRMCLIKIVELAIAMQQGVHLNKSWLDLMHNGGGIDVAFLLHTRKSAAVHLIFHRIVCVPISS